MQVRSLSREDPLEEGMSTHSSTLAQRIPWTEEPGRLQSIGSQSQTKLKLLSTQYMKCFYNKQQIQQKKIKIERDKEEEEKEYI